MPTTTNSNVPFGQQNRDAYEAMIRAVAIQLRTIPDDCVTELVAYDGASHREQQDFDLGDIPTGSLESFLKVRSALVEGISMGEVPPYYKQEAVRDIQMAPRLFSKPSLVQRLEVFGSSGKEGGQLVGGVVKAIQEQPMPQPRKGASGSTVCQLKD